MQNDVYNSHPCQYNEAEFIGWIIHVDIYFVSLLWSKNIIVMIKTSETSLFSLHCVIKNHVHERRRYICILSLDDTMNTHSLLNIEYSYMQSGFFVRVVIVKYILFVCVCVCVGGGGGGGHKRGCILLNFYESFFWCGKSLSFVWSQHLFECMYLCCVVLYCAVSCRVVSCHVMSCYGTLNNLCI